MSYKNEKLKWCVSRLRDTKNPDCLWLAHHAVDAALSCEDGCCSSCTVMLISGRELLQWQRKDIQKNQFGKHQISVTCWSNSNIHMDQINQHSITW